MESKTPVKDILQEVAKGNLSELDMFNTVEQLTKGNPQKLKLLQKDVSKSIEEEEEESKRRISNYTYLLSVIKENSIKPPTVEPGQEDYALLCALNDEPIENYVTKPSEKQVKHCTHYKDKGRRTTIKDSDSYTVCSHKLNRYEKIQPYLNEDGKRRADEDIQIIKTQMDDFGIKK